MPLISTHNKLGRHVTIFLDTSQRL